MGDNKELIERLRKHCDDYKKGYNQNYIDVCFDCGTAAEVLESVISERDELERERNTLKARLEHLLLSNTVSRYDALNHCGGYVLDIGGLDKENEERIALLAEVKELRAWCDNINMPAPDPVPVVPEVFYICDRRACEVCTFECKYTGDIRHAKHFELFERTFYEQEG